MLELKIDGARPVDAGTVETVNAGCDRSEDSGLIGPFVVRVSGAPAAASPIPDLSVGLVTKWERALRRLERLTRVTVAVATGDCGGAALDAFLTADVRIAAPGTQLLVVHDGSATWPGMAAYRLARLAGAGSVRQAVLFGQPIDLVTAQRTGLIDIVTDDPDASIAGLPAERSGKEAAIRRQLLLDAGHTSFEDALGAHLAACDRMLRTPAGVAS